MVETELYIVDWWVGLVVTIMETELYMADVYTKVCLSSRCSQHRT